MLQIMEATVTSIFIAFCIIMTLVVSLMTCVCCRNKKYSENTPCEENPSEDSRNNNGQPKIVASVHGNVDETLSSELDNTDSATRESPTHRRLPPIPQNSEDDSPRLIGDPVYTTVDESSPIFAATSGLNLSSGEFSVHPISDSALDGPVIISQSSMEIDVDTDTYDDPAQVYAQDKKASTSRCDAAIIEHPPPVPEKRFDSAESSPAIYPTGRPVSAANAVAGRASVSEIPFISSPADSTRDLGNADSQVLETDNRYQPDLHYNVISVRESLAYLKESMSRPSHAHSESIYSVVPEDSDQMYYEICSCQNSATSSVTYSKIASINSNVASNLRPDPPTVESLQNVAQAAHSRNASYSGAVGETVDLRSWNHDSSNFNRGLVTASELSGCEMPLYAKVNKANKSRHSVQLVEDLQHKDDLVEELYSPVRKENLQGARPKQFNKEHDKPYKVLPKSNLVHNELRIDSLMPSGLGSDTHLSPVCIEDPGYEKINDSPKYWSENFEQPIIGSNSCASERTSLQNLQQLQKSTVRAEKVCSGIDFGYETVHGNSMFGNYESIQDGSGYIYRDDENEPGYEAVANQSEYPGYEQVSDSSFQRSDPNYESVRYSTRLEMVQTSETGQNEPRYWDIRSNEELNDPLYERIRSQEDDQTDPNYEKVKAISELSYESSEPGYARIPPSEYGYENVREDNVLNEEQTDPGYEKIFENKLELHIEWSENSVGLNGESCNSDFGWNSPIEEVHTNPQSSRNSSSDVNLIRMEARSTSNEIFRNPFEQITIGSTEQNLIGIDEPFQESNAETIYIPLNDEQPPSLL